MRILTKYKQELIECWILLINVLKNNLFKNKKLNEKDVCFKKYIEGIHIIETAPNLFLKKKQDFFCEKPKLILTNL